MRHRSNVTHLTTVALDHQSFVAVDVTDAANHFNLVLVSTSTRLRTTRLSTATTRHRTSVYTSQHKTTISQKAVKYYIRCSSTILMYRKISIENFIKNLLLCQTAKRIMKVGQHLAQLRAIIRWHIFWLTVACLSCYTLYYCCHQAAWFRIIQSTVTLCSWQVKSTTAHCRLTTGVVDWGVMSALRTALSVCSEVQMICIWSSWYQCRPIISCFITIQIGLTFVVPAYPGCCGKEAAKWVSVCLSALFSQRSNYLSFVANTCQYCLGLSW